MTGGLNLKSEGKGGAGTEGGGNIDRETPGEIRVVRRWQKFSRRRRHHPHPHHILRDRLPIPPNLCLHFRRSQHLANRDRNHASAFRATRRTECPSTRGRRSGRGRNLLQWTIQLSLRLYHMRWYGTSRTQSSTHYTMGRNLTLPLPQHRVLIGIQGGDRQTRWSSGMAPQQHIPAGAQDRGAGMESCTTTRSTKRA